MLMVAEANFFCSQTGLCPGRMLSEMDICEGSSFLQINPNVSFGCIITDDYFFGFGWGHLVGYRKRGFMNYDSDDAIRQRNMELSKFTSLIDTNGAYQLATNWLAKLEIDVETLEEKYKLNVSQLRYYPDGVQGKIIYLPVFVIEWRGNVYPSRPNQESKAVSITIFGATKEIVEYHIIDPDNILIKRPKLKIKDVDKLLSIPDDEFMKYDVLQRSNLVYRFSDCPSIVSTNIIFPLNTNKGFRLKPIKKNNNQQVQNFLNHLKPLIPITNSHNSIKIKSIRPKNFN